MYYPHAFILIILTFVLNVAALSVHAAEPVDGVQYRETMNALDEVQTLMLSTVDNLQTGMNTEKASQLQPRIEERLQWIRDVKVKAVMTDNSGEKMQNLNAERRRARCIIMRSGLLDDSLQDIMVNVTLKARNRPDTELLPLNREEIAGLDVPSACPSA